MLMNAQAVALCTIPFRIVKCLGRRIVCQRRLAHVVIAIREVRQVGPFGSQEIQTYGINGDSVLRCKQTSGPVAVEGSHLPFQVWWIVHEIVRIERVDKEEHCLSAQILMAQEIGKRRVAGSAIAVLIEMIVRILAPVRVDVGRSEEILRGKGDAGCNVPLEEGGINQVRGLNRSGRDAGSVLARNRKWNRIDLELRFEPPVSSDVIYERHVRVKPVNLVKKVRRNETAGVEHRNIGGLHVRYLDQLLDQRQRQMR